MSDDPDSESLLPLGSRGRPVASGLAAQMSELARTMQAESDPQAVLDRIVAAAVTEIPGAMYAGVTFFAQGRFSTEAASDPLVRQVDRVQYVVNDGPCVQSSRAHETVRSDDLETDGRWPRFASGAVALGIKSMLSVQLFVPGSNIGALNLYATTQKSFDDADEDVALILGSHAAVALAAHIKRANLEVALDSRDLIGQAKGILMERYRITAQNAFDLLVTASQHRHVKVRDVAFELTQTGDLGAG